jgi:CRP/FNR family transcriptional regulator, anaerobic regulatory protein
MLAYDSTALRANPPATLPCSMDSLPQQPVQGSSFPQICELLQINHLMDAKHETARFEHVRVRSGQCIHLAGQACDRLYVVRSGYLKTSMPPVHGHEQIMDFLMRGDLIGAEGMASGRHTLEALALQQSELAVLPLDTLRVLGRTHGGLIAALCGVMARGLARDPLLIGARAGLGTHARIARFLLYLAQREADCGYSSGNVAMRLQRTDIANYLGMAVETVSRTMGALEERGLIAIGRDNVWIKQPDALRTLRRLPAGNH